MYRIKVSVDSDGLHPSEVCIKIDTVNGPVYASISRKSLAEDNTIDIGYPISRVGAKYMVELPREADNGTWRVWVDQKNVIVPKDMK